MKTRLLQGGFVGIIAAAAVAALPVGCGHEQVVTPGPKTAGSPTTATPTATEPQKNRDPFPSKLPSTTGFRLTEAFPGLHDSFVGDEQFYFAPLTIAFTKTQPSTAFVLTKGGRVYAINGTAKSLALDFMSECEHDGEAGAVGIALHPNFSATPPVPYMYVWYNARPTKGARHQRLVRYTWDPGSRTFPPFSQTVLLEEEEKSLMHNSGRIQFGPDGFLYFGNGDDDQKENRQTMERALFGGIFRIDVDMRGGKVSHPPPRQPQKGRSSNYYIPNDNPFVGRPNTLEEFYALGFRNPYGLSFDRETGQLWSPDVGDTLREEVNLVVPGGNYEWPLREGDLPYAPGELVAGKAQPPVYTYAHREIGDLSAIIGGYVYRGKRFPELRGQYVYADWRSGRVWSLDVSRKPAVRHDLISNNHELGILGISEDNDGELYFATWKQIYKLEKDASVAAIPKKLSETGLFRDVVGLVPSERLIPYSVNSPLWSDGAGKQRWVALPPGKTAELSDGEVLKLPPGSLAVKHFELPQSAAPRGRSRRLETRVLVVADEVTYGLTYKWNAEGTDAELLTEALDERFVDDATGGTRTWHFPNMSDCWSCHRRHPSRFLGLTLAQLNRKLPNGTNQLSDLASRGVFAKDTLPSYLPSIPDPSDTSAPLEARALAYLAGNCDGCHSGWNTPFFSLIPYGGSDFVGGGIWVAVPGVPLGMRMLVNAPFHNPPVAAALGVSQGKLIVPGHPEQSLLLARMASNEPDLRMPPIARNQVDDAGVALIREWIKSMPAR